MLSRCVARSVAATLRSRTLHADTKSASVAIEQQQPQAQVPPTEVLTDSFGRRHNYLRISLTEKCNLRCTYCMPAGGADLSARAQLLTTDELLALVRVFAVLGVDKLRLTGGEPTLRRDLPELIQELKSIPGIRSVSMTTNGLVLTRRLPALQRAGLDALNVSLDTLRPERYERLARRPGLARVLAGVDLALQLGYAPLKLNTVLMKGVNDDELYDFVELTRDRDIEVRFIEFMPFSGNGWGAGGLLPARAALRHLAARYELAPAAAAPHDTSRMWAAAGLRGRVGFIASMTQPFCGGCNRLRLTADGNLKVCLFGSAEVSLRDALRAGAATTDLAALVREALHRKKKQHAGTTQPYGESRKNEKSSHDTNRRVVWSPLVVPSRRCSSLSHVDGGGRARMVDVGGKPATRRSAAAACALRVGPAALALLRDHAAHKGHALAVAEAAGVLAAKQTSNLIPLCHPLVLDVVRVRIDLPPEGEEGEGGEVNIHCSVRCAGRTGAEMEALVGAALAALALYDMVKAADPRMVLADLRVVNKQGGKADFCLEENKDEPAPAPAPAPATNTSTATESYTPSSYMH